MLKKWRAVALVMLVVLPLLGLAQKAAADMMGVGFTVIPGVTGCSQSGSSTNASETCAFLNGNGTQGSVALSGSAGIGNLAASAQVTNADVELVVNSYFQQNVAFGSVGYLVCPDTPGVVGCSAGGQLKYFPAGTVFNAALYFSLNGSWSYSGAGWAYIHPVTQVALNGHTYLDDATHNQDCNNYDYGVPYAPCNATASGDVSAILASAPISIVSGQNYLLRADFDLFVQCGAFANCKGDFLDPTLTDIEITDPTTGLPVEGISVTGDDGSIYPVNLNEAAPIPTPEPGTIYLLGFVLIAAALGRLR